MTNEELAELERLLKAPPSPHGRWYDLGGWLSVNADAVLSALREAEALRAKNARLTKAVEAVDPAQLHPVAAKLFRAALEQGEVK